MYKNILSAAVMLSFMVMLPSMTWAEEPAPVEAASPAVDGQPLRFTEMTVDYRIGDNGAVEMTSRAVLKVLREEAVKDVKERTISYSTSIEKVDVVEAYTLKADGRKIEVPKDNYQLQVNSGHEGNKPSYSDESSLTIIFPDLAVGDSAVMTYKQTDLEPIFPGHFSFMQSYSKYYPYDDVKLSVDMPVALGAKYEAYGLTEASNTTENGRQHIVWTYKNPHPPKYEESYSVPYTPADDNVVLVSTFPSYKEIAAAYGERAMPRAVVTPEIQKLADEIAGPEKEPRQVAKALYDWIIKNITYAGNCIGVGAVVPRDLGFVLGNKMGDCKDHATLLQALLAAKGIGSTQALIGVNDIYAMPKTPVVSTINHVINYIPSLDLFVDATAGLPFGILPPGLYSKPVLLVDGYKEGQLTPSIPDGMRSSKVDTKVVMAADGSAVGTVDIFLKGYSAYSSHQTFSRQSEDDRKMAAKRMLARYAYTGELDVTPGTFDEAALTFSYHFKFKISNFIPFGAPGGMAVTPPFADATMVRAIGGVIQGKDMVVPERFLCGNMRTEENYSYTYPPSISLLAVPTNVVIATPIQSYTAEYAQDGQVVTVHRLLDDSTPGPVCEAALNANYLQVAEKAWPDLKAQIVYK